MVVTEVCLSFSLLMLLPTGSEAQSIPGYKPLSYVRKTGPVDGQTNDIYQVMESQVASLQPGQTIVYASVPLYAPLSKDPENAGDSYVVMAEKDAVLKDAQDRRVLEDVLLEMGFPLEQLTQVDNSGRVVRLHGNPESGARDPWSSSDRDPVTDSSQAEWVTEITYQAEATTVLPADQERSSFSLLQTGGNNRPTLAKFNSRLSPYPYARSLPQTDKPNATTTGS